MAAPTTTSTAVLLAIAEDDQGDVACLLPADGRTLLARLVDQLTTVGVRQVIVLTRPQWAAAVAQAADVAVEAYGSVPAMLDRLAQLAGATTADLLIAHADLLTHDAAVANLVLDSRVRTGVLSGSASSPLPCPPMRVSEDRVVASGSAYHRCERANAQLLGMCKVGRADIDTVARVLTELAVLLASGPPVEWSVELGRTRAALAAEVTATGGSARAERSVATLRDDPLPLVVVGLVRCDVSVTPVDMRELYWGRPQAAAAAVTAVEELQRIDEDKVVLDAAVKDVDGFFTTFFVSPYSRYIARWAARRGLTPNQVTVASMGLGLLAAAAFAAGSRTALVAGAVMLQLAFIADCVDGQLARYTRTFSRFGAWLDSVLDRGKEYVVYAGLAIGATAAPAVDVPAAGIWFMATAALTLQTFRHYADFSHGAQRRMTRPPPIRYRLDAAGESPVETPAPDVAVEPARTTPTGVGRAAVSALVTFGRRPWVTWARRVIVLPIGERFALISVTAAVWDARVTFAALLAGYCRRGLHHDRTDPEADPMTDITPQVEHAGPPSPRPIFIVGCPRSGTTLLQLMLHAHPDIAIPPENRFLLELYDRRQEFGDLREPDNRKRLARFVVSRRRSKVRDFGVDARSVRRQIMRAAPTVGTAAATVFSAYAAQFGKRRWGDKRPSYIQRLDTIVRLFPDAQVIHIIRDGRDCVSSLKRMPWWRGGTIKAIWTWRNAIVAGERARARLGHDAYTEVRYEDLVRDPRPQLRRLCDFLDEPFDEAMLQPHRMADVAVPERKLWHTGTHEPVNDGAVQRWRRDLDQWELDLLEFTAARQLRLHGYELSRGRRPVPPIRPLLRFLRLYARRNARRLQRRLRDARMRRAYAWPVAAQPSGLERSMPSS